VRDHLGEVEQTPEEVEGCEALGAIVAEHEDEHAQAGEEPIEKQE